MRFLLVDRVGDYEPGKSMHGIKCAAMSEDYFEWHFPERPIVPGMLILEAFVQLAGWLEAASSDFEHWFLLEHVSSARYYDFAVPGDVIDLTLECLENDDEGKRTYRAESRVGDKRGATLEFSGRLVPLETLKSRAAARAHFARLRREA